MVDLESTASLLDLNKKLISGSDQSLDPNTDLLQALSQLVHQVPASEKPFLTSLLGQLYTTQAQLDLEFKEKMIDQERLRLELNKKNTQLAIESKKLQDREIDLEKMIKLSAESGIVLENQLKIDEIEAKIAEKRKNIQNLEELNNEHLKNIEEKTSSKIGIMEKECKLRDKLRILENELEKKKNELDKTESSFRDMETGRLNQSMSPRSLSTLNQISLSRISPVRESRNIHESTLLATDSLYDRQTTDQLENFTPVENKSTSRYTFLLLAFIFLLVAIILKFVF